MSNFLKAIKKKKHKRQICALWLFLIVLELLCPILSDERIYTAEAAAPKSEANLQINSADQKKDDNYSAAVSSAPNNQNQYRHTGNVNCNDECLCHAAVVLITGIIAFKEAPMYSEPIPFHFDNPVYQALPPHYHPPRIS